MALDPEHAAGTNVRSPGVFPGTGGCTNCYLGPMCLPGRLAPGDTERLRRIVRPLPPLRPRQVLFDGGAPRGQLYIVRAGCLRTSVREGNGSDTVVDFLLPGDITGFGTGVGTMRGTRAIALERSNVCAIRFADLHGLAARIPGLQEQLYRLIERTMANTGNHVLMMGQRTAPERLALFLLNWSSRRRAAGFSDVDLDLPMRREDLASYLGLVTETASRAVSRLQGRELIEVLGRHRIRLLDPQRLADLAETDVEANGVSARAV